MSQITATELKGRLAAGDAVSIVDIRERSDYEDWHIHGSTNVPAYDALRQGRGPDLERGDAGAADGARALYRSLCG
jgi:rhodanese-related sulfurtransferase